MWLLRTAGLALMLGLAACRSSQPLAGPGRPLPSLTPLPSLAARAFVTATPGHSPQPAAATPTASPTDPGPGYLAATLAAGLLSELAPTATPQPDGFSMFSGLSGVQAFPLEDVSASGPLWVAFSQGERNYDPLQDHFVALYTRRAGAWQLLSRVELENPDILSPGAVQPLALGGAEPWLAVWGLAGAHSGCFDLLQVAGGGLQHRLSSCASSPPGAELADLNRDSRPEVLLDWSDEYVFCYSCGLRVPLYQVWRWDGAELVQVELAPLPAAAPEGLRRLNDQAIVLAQAELWQDAWETIRQIGAAGDAAEWNSTEWNSALIELHATRRAKAVGSSPYPLLAHIFAGDYPAALELFRPLRPEKIFTPQSPLLVGTAAAGQEANLSAYLLQFTDKALAARPDLAGAYFVRAWASYLVNPEGQFRHDLQSATRLAPSDPLFAACAAYFGVAP